MKHIVMGLVAHVDAGKTTLSESILYKSNVIRTPGRVDNGDTYFDTDAIEKKRGITIFSKQTEIQYISSNDKASSMEITLLDTPGHVDFSAETERVLSVLDYAVLLISALDGVQSHTRTLMRLLRLYNIPTFIFVNKMDVSRISQGEIIDDIHKSLGSECIDMSHMSDNLREDTLEEIALYDEAVLDEYMSNGNVSDLSISRLIYECKIIPIYFGSALTTDGVVELLDNVSKYTLAKEYNDTFSAKVYKVIRDKNNTRLTLLKVTGGTLKVKDDVLPYGEYPNQAKKVNEIRIINGDKYESRREVKSGYIAAVTGLNNSYPGQGLGFIEDSLLPSLVPTVSYTVILSDDQDPHHIYDLINILADEDPMLMPTWDERTKRVGVSLMGQLQLEVIKQKMYDRFGADIDFGSGDIIYKETIKQSITGHGHFEPLLHFADVVLRLEPLPAGSNIEVISECSNDVLLRQHQQQILKQCLCDNAGILTGSTLTDIRYVITGGRAHKKHTEGGDFRQAAKIAIRNALLKAENVLLEPYYLVRLDLPSDYVGRAMTDISNMYGKLLESDTYRDHTVIEGIVPVALSLDYASTVKRYTKGLGDVSFELSGFYPCHNTEEVIERFSYNYVTDLSNPYQSIYVHGNATDINPLIEDDLQDKDNKKKSDLKKSKKDKKPTLDDELDMIFEKTYGKVKKQRVIESKEIIAKRDEEKIKNARNEYFKAHPNEDKKNTKKVNRIKKKYLLVDGYNVIHAWDNLRELSYDNMDAARDALIDILSNYQGYSGEELIVVFDAYKIKGGIGSFTKNNNIYVVYTKEAQTADAYIERITHQIFKREDAIVKVVSSDALIQMIVLGDGAMRISANEFRTIIKELDISIK